MYADKIEPMGLKDFCPQYIQIMEPVGHIRNYRGLPEPYREISLDEFLWISTGWTPTASKFLQVILPDEKLVRSGWAIFNNLYGYAYLQGIAEYGVDKFGRSTYLMSKNARYFRLGCEHPKTMQHQWIIAEKDMKCPDCLMSFGYPDN